MFTENKLEYEDSTWLKNIYRLRGRRKHDEAGVFNIDVSSKSTHRDGTAEKLRT